MKNIFCRKVFLVTLFLFALWPLFATAQEQPRLLEPIHSVASKAVPNLPTSITSSDQNYDYPVVDLPKGRVPIEKCEKLGMTGNECYISEEKKLKKINDRLDREIIRELQSCEPKMLGYDFKSAINSHVASRKYFEKYLENFCSTGAYLFGPGTGLTVAAATCEIRLREFNIEKTKYLMGFIKSTKKFLAENPLDEDGESKPSIICK